MTLQTIAQLIMLATLILMITGRTPIYMTAITGAAISAIVAGFPLAGGQGMTVTKMIVSGLNPVIADMTGILLFIGIMQATGFLDVIIRDIVRVGNKIEMCIRDSNNVVDFVKLGGRRLRKGGCRESCTGGRAREEEFAS